MDSANKLKDIYLENLDNLMERDDKLCDLIEKSRRLSNFNTANKKNLKEGLLKRKSNKVVEKKAEQKRKCLIVILLVLAVIVVYGIFVVYMCGGYDFKSC